MQWLSFFKKIQLLIDHMFISIRLFLAVHPSWFDFLYSVLASFSPKKSQVNFSPWRMKPIWSIDCLKCLRQCALDFATLSFIWVVNLTVCGDREVKTKDNFLRFFVFCKCLQSHVILFYCFCFSKFISFHSLWKSMPIYSAIETRDFSHLVRVYSQNKTKKITAGSWEQNSKKERKKIYR